MRRPPDHLPGITVLCVVVGAAAPGCVSDLDVTASEPVLWEAELIAEPDHPGVSGSAAAVSRADLTEAGISVSGLAPGIYDWGIREGACAAPGAHVGAEGQYPELVVETPDPDEEGEDGPASVSTETPPFRGSMVEGRAYHVQLRVRDSDVRVACGGFTRI